MKLSYLKVKSLLIIILTGFLSQSFAARIDLTKLNWEFRKAGNTAWLPATVPGTVHTDLLANKKIENPFYRTNEKDQQWIEKEDWEYRAKFNVDSILLKDENVELEFQGLDTYADVYVNEQKVLIANNMFRSWKINVKNNLKQGANQLQIYFVRRNESWKL